MLAVRLDSAGDVLLMGPAIRALAHGSRRVSLLCGPRGIDAAELLPGISEILVFEAAWIDPEPRPLDAEGALSLVKEIASRGIDQAVVFTSFHQSPLPLALILRMAGVEHIAAICEDYPGSLLDIRHRVPADIHEVERALSLAKAAGFVLPEGDDKRLQVTPASGPMSRKPFAIRPPYVVVHPGASVQARAWAPERHAALVQALASAGMTVAVTGGPSEQALTRLVCEQAAAGTAARAMPGRDAGDDPIPGVFDLGGKLTLTELAYLLRGAETAIVANTGPAHLAAAVGTPVVSLFAPTVPAVRWRPWGVPHVLLGDQQIACAGCRAKQCPVPGHPCLDDVSVEDVVEALDELRSRDGVR